jgi:hypothetical protein
METEEQFSDGERQALQFIADVFQDAQTASVFLEPEDQAVETMALMRSIVSILDRGVYCGFAFDGGVMITTQCPQLN